MHHDTIISMIIAYTSGDIPIAHRYVQLHDKLKLHTVT